MRRLTFVGITLALLASASLSQAQQPPEFPQPQKEHEWLKQFVGEWEIYSKGSFAPDTPPGECIGTISGRMLGGFWVINEMKGDMAGVPTRAVQTIGYDPAKKKYVGTLVDSMMNQMLQYKGTVDKTGKKLSLDADAPAPSFTAGGRTTTYRDVYEFQSPDHILWTSSYLGEDGEWFTLSTLDAKRVKAKEGN